MYGTSGSVYVVAYLWFFLYISWYSVFVFLGGFYDRSQGALYVLAFFFKLFDIFLKNILWI
jgi:hypothetical protein